MRSGCKLLEERDHLFKMVDVLAMHDQIRGEGQLVLADGARQFDLVGVRLCASDPVGGVFVRILEADLDVIEPGVHQRLQPRFGEADARGDEVGIESCGARAGDEFGQVLRAPAVLPR